MTIKKVTSQESSNQSQTIVVKLPKLQKINSITVNTGQVESYTINGEDVTIKLKNGVYTRYEYRSSGYWDYKTISTSRNTPELADTCEPSINYTSSDGYQGVIPCISCFHNTSTHVYEGFYSGQGSKWIDTSYVVYYYTYEITIDYVDRATPVGYMRIYGLSIPVFNQSDIAGRDQHRFQAKNGTFAFELVDTNHEYASKLRMYTPNGIKSIAK